MGLKSLPIYNNKNKKRLQRFGHIQQMEKGRFPYIIIIKKKITKVWTYTANGERKIPIYNNNKKKRLQRFGHIQQMEKGRFPRRE